MYSILSLIGTVHNDEASLVPLLNCFAVEDEQAAVCFTEQNAKITFYFSKTGFGSVTSGSIILNKDIHPL